MKTSFLLFCSAFVSCFFLQAQSIDFKPLPSSPEGSATLAELIGDQQGNLYAIFPANFDTNGGYFCRSQDSGVSWQKMNYALRDMSLAPDGTLYRLQADNLFRSHDQGFTWSLAHSNAWLNSTSRILITSAGTLLAADNPVISRSTDQGETWQNVPLPTSATSYLFTVPDGTAYAFSPKQVGNDYWNDVFRSTDDGLTWQLVGELPDIFFDGFLFQTTSGRLVKGDDDLKGIYYSDNQGANWTKCDQIGFGNIRAQSIIQQPSGRIWITTSNSWRYYSDDDGNTWMKGGPSGAGDPLTYLWQMPDGSVWGNFSYSLFKANDDTLENWTFLSLGIQEPLVLDMKALDEQRLYVCTTAGMFRTLDGGNTWTHFFQQPIYSKWLGRNTAQFCLDDLGNVVLADGNRLWRIEPQTGAATDITPPGLQTLPGLTNGMETIARLPDGDLVAGTSKNFRSSDNGETWTLFSPSLGSFTGFITKILETHYVSDTAWILNDDTVIDFWYNPVTDQARPITIFNINTLEGTTVDANGGIHTMLNNFNDPAYCFSDDFGTNWECVYDKPFWLLGEMIVNLAGQIFVLSDFGLYASEDEGHNWNLIFQANAPHPNHVRRFCHSPNQYLFIAPTGLGIHRSALPAVSQTLKRTITSNEPVLLVFPNPSVNGNVYVEIPDWLSGNDSEVLLKDLWGKVLHREKAFDKSIRLNLEEFAPGIYFITWRSKRGEVSSKWVKMNP